QRHQRADLVARAPPIVGGESEQRERADAQIGGGLHHPADRVCAGAMSRRPRQGAARRPAPVAVHDDGDMQTIPASYLVAHLSSPNTLHCKANAQKNYTVFRRRRPAAAAPAASPDFAALAASRTTCSSTFK